MAEREIIKGQMMLSQTPLPNICPAYETTAGQIQQTKPKPQ